MADWRATSDWTARMRETPNLARNTVFVEEAAPKPQTQQPYRGGRPGAPPSGIRDGDWQCPECPNVNFARRMECHRCGAPRPYEPRKPRARQLRDDEEPRYRRPRPRDRSEERDRHRRRSRSRSRDGGRKFERGRHKGEPPKEDNWRCGHCQNDNWGWRKVRFSYDRCVVITTHRSATAARSRGPRTSRRARAAAGASTSATTRPTGARRRRTRTTATTTSGGGRSPRRARPSARRVGSVGGGFKLRSAFRRRALYCLGINAGRGARAAPGRARPALIASRPGGVRRAGATPVT